jgi:predicted nucleotidyltransferase
MIDRIEDNRQQVVALCRRHSVKRLELFGSAASGGFKLESSDLDFFVEFISYDTPTIADQWFGLQEDLENLFGRRVDLTSLRAANNPHFLEAANRHKVTLYAA